LEATKIITPVIPVQNRAIVQPQPQQQAAINTVLARLVNLSVSALRAESLQKAGNIIVNQIHTIVKAERVVIVPLKDKDRILCISGDLEPSQDNSFAQAAQEIRKAFGKESEPKVISKETLPQDLNAHNAEKVLEAMGGTQLLWMLIPAPHGKTPMYALWMERWENRPWTEEEIKLLSHATVFFGHALVPREKAKKTAKARLKLWLTMGIIFLGMFFPIPARITAPVQIMPDHPYYVFAPFDGTIESLAVKPGEKIKKGDLIFRYDTRMLEKRLEEAQRGSLAVALAELARLEGAAYSEEEARARIPVQKLEVERRKSEVTFLQQQMGMSEVRSEAEGVVVLDDPDALIGASVQTGELVMSIADPKQTKLRIMVPVSDAGWIKEGSAAVAWLDSDPMRSIYAKVNRIGFDVRMSDKHIPSILVEAEWEKKESANAMPGARGTARIDGPKVSIGLYFFRKPLMLLRTVIGI